jgi:UDP-3-O-[3-hydroxymyristoyl] N-acetylglucosamine deacetylase
VKTSPIHLESVKRKQKTLRSEASFTGIGIHTAQQVSLKFVPAKEGTGIVFKRVDLPGQPVIPATVEYVKDTSRSTTVGINEVRIHTVEHVLAAVNAYEIDNLIIELSNIEPPVGNGSSDVFVDIIEKVGIEEQTATVPIFKLQKPVYWADDEIQIVGIPYDGYRISYTLNYPHNKILKAQFHTTSVDSQTFKNEIAPCRTFSLYEEVSYLMDKGLIKGGSLDNAVVVKDDVVLSKGGLFFPDEMARHKILDMIGDLSLIGIPFHAHIISVRSGHASNYAFAKTLYHHLNRETADV